MVELTLGILSISHVGMLRMSPGLCLEAMEETAGTPTTSKTTHHKALHLAFWGGESEEPVSWANWKFFNREPCGRSSGSPLPPSKVERSGREPPQAGEAGTYKPGRVARVLLAEATMLRVIQADPEFQNHLEASKTTNWSEVSVKLCILLLFTIEN